MPSRGLPSRADPAPEFWRAGFFVSVLGIAVAVWTNMSYWNWYGFPRRYTAVYMVTEVVGFIVAGVVIALVLKNKPLNDSQ